MYEKKNYFKNSVPCFRSYWDCFCSVINHCVHLRMTKQFFPTCSIVLMCITSTISLGSLIAAIVLDGYHLYAISFGMVLLTLSMYRDYRRETPRKKITVSINSFHRVQQRIDMLNMDVIIHHQGEWVEIVYPEIESDRLTRLLFTNQVKIHN